MERNLKTYKLCGFSVLCCTLSLCRPNFLLKDSEKRSLTMNEETFRWRHSRRVMWKMNNRLKCIVYLHPLRVINIIFPMFFRQPNKPLHLEYMVTTIRQFYLHFLQNCTNIWTEEWALYDSTPSQTITQRVHLRLTLGLTTAKRKGRKMVSWNPLSSPSIIPIPLSCQPSRLYGP